MNYIKKYLNNFIRIFLLLFVLSIGVINLSLISFDETKVFYYSVLLIIFVALLIWMYKNKLISRKIFRFIMVMYFILGIVLRVILMCGIKINLFSDFELYFDTANGILNGTYIRSDYLSFNGYVYVFCSVLAVIFKFFGSKVMTVYVFNLICQILSSYFLYKIVNLKASKETSLVLSATYFLLPNIILSNLLVSTESFFMLMFLISIYAYYKVIDKKELNSKNIIKLVLFGLLISFTNNIRPVMSIFLIALVVCYIINLKRPKELLFLVIILVSYFISGFAFNKYVENGIGTKLRSGALGWSIYYGTNVENCGGWNPDDETFIFDYLEDESNGNFGLIKESINRLSSNDFKDNYRLFKCKFDTLWKDSAGTYGFVEPISNKELSTIDLSQYRDPLYNISYILVSFITVVSIVSIIIEIKRKDNQWLFIELFSLGYILANLLVCLNSRYNLPLYPLLLISGSILLDRLMKVKQEEIKEKEITSINKKKKKVLLIVPAYNEEESIEKTINSIIKSGYDYVIINDGSKDNTENICLKNNYNIISLPINLGIGGAVQTGYKYALENNYDIAIQFDADGQHDINCVKKLIDPIINKEAHFVIGSRFIESSDDQFNSTKMRRIGIKIISFFIHVFSHKKIYDTTSGFRAANIDVIKKFAGSYPLEYPEPISSFELMKQGYKVKEVSVKMHERQGGKTSISSWKNVYYMFNVIISIIILQIRGDNK